MIMRISTCTFAFLILLTATGFAQRRLDTFKNKVHSHHGTQAASKAASHDDLPTMCNNFDWNDTLNQWDSTSRTHFTYFPNGDFAEVISEQYVGLTFVPSYRATYSFNNQTNTYKSINYNWNGSVWENSYRSDETRDVNGNPILFIDYFWNVSQWDTSGGERLNLSYVLVNKIGQSVSEVWNAGLWETRYREEYAWPNAQGWDSATFSDWNGSAWDYTERYVDVTWHDFPQFLATTARYQSYVGPQWEDGDRFTATFGTYDSYTQISEEWTGSSWVNSYKEVNVNDSLEHNTLFEDYIWNGQWDPSYAYATAYTYDLQGHTEEAIYQSSTNGGPFINNYRQVYSTFFTNAPDPDMATTSVQAYPNPCTDRLNFMVELQQNGPVQIALYDLQGRLRAQTLTPAQVGQAITIPVSEVLENGTYVYRVTSKLGEATGKVAVQR